MSACTHTDLTAELFHVELDIKYKKSTPSHITGHLGEIYLSRWQIGPVAAL